MFIFFLTKALKKRKLLLYKRKLLLQRAYDSTRNRFSIRSTSLIANGEDSPWYQVYASKDDSAFISLVSLNFGAFNKLLAVFARHYPRAWGPGTVSQCMVKRSFSFLMA